MLAVMWQSMCCVPCLLNGVALSIAISCIVVASPMRDVYTTTIALTLIALPVGDLNAATLQVERIKSMFFPGVDTMSDPQRFERCMNHLIFGHCDGVPANRFSGGWTESCSSRDGRTPI